MVDYYKILDIALNIIAPGDRFTISKMKKESGQRCFESISEMQLIHSTLRSQQELCKHSFPYFNEFWY
jgi:hypothetical protein